LRAPAGSGKPKQSSCPSVAEATVNSLHGSFTLYPSGHWQPKLRGD
jgi:hypothetical protein